MEIRSLQQKKIAVLGLGIEGQALLDFFQEHRIQPSVLDKKTQEELGALYKQYEAGVQKWCLGEAYDRILSADSGESGLSRFDIIFRTPGFPRKHPALLAAENHGTRISSETELFFELSPTRNIIGITGTKGKGTVALLTHAGLITGGKKAFLAGNIGKTRLALLKELTADSWVVLELSSFQLEGFPHSPHIAVVLGIMLDHMDYHHSRENYVAAKRSIVEHQTVEDVAILDFDNPVAKSFAQETQAQVKFFSAQEAPKSSAFIREEKLVLRNGNKEEAVMAAQDIPLRGKHNLKNVCAAALALHTAGINLDAIRDGIRNFSGQPHRLELAGEIKGVRFYNDSASTIPESAVAAIEAFTEPVILICGGQEKGITFDFLAEGILRNAAHMRKVLLTGTAAPKIAAALREYRVGDRIYEILPREASMADIIRKAHAYARYGDIVLLSPAATSYDRYTNYAERGESFKMEVAKLLAGS